MKRRHWSNYTGLIAICLIGAIPVSAQHESPATKEPHVSQLQIDAQEHRAAVDEANRRQALELERAEIADDYRVVNAGGLVRVKASAELWSGEGKNFSDWYQLTSDAVPAGYVLDSVVFRLVGDRSCGAWAECLEVQRTQGATSWAFRMQGHDEDPRLEVSAFEVSYVVTDSPGNPGHFTFNIDVHFAGRRATSVALLKTRYVPIR
jgi:hypothetical protein